MARQDANEQFLATSFLDGANAAYIEQLHAKYEANPASVGEEWQAFFKALADEPSDVVKAAKGASWKRANWPIARERRCICRMKALPTGSTNSPISTTSVVRYMMAMPAVTPLKVVQLTSAPSRRRLQRPISRETSTITCASAPTPIARKTVAQSGE